MQTENGQVSVESVNDYKVLANTKSVSLFPQLNRYFGLMCTLVDHHKVSFKQLIAEYDLKLTKQPANEKYFAKFEDKMLYLTEPCLKSASLYFRNLLTNSEDMIEIDYVSLV